MVKVEAPFQLGEYELDVCPFCEFADIDIVGEDHDDRSLSASIECPNCPCKMESYLAYGRKEPPSKKKMDELVKYWNDRVKSGKENIRTS